jgi:hypothetical protein
LERLIVLAVKKSEQPARTLKLAVLPDLAATRRVQTPHSRHIPSSKRGRRGRLIIPIEDGLEKEIVSRANTGPYLILERTTRLATQMPMVENSNNESIILVRRGSSK